MCHVIDSEFKSLFAGRVEKFKEKHDILVPEAASTASLMRLGEGDALVDFLLKEVGAKVGVGPSFQDKGEAAVGGNT